MALNLTQTLIDSHLVSGNMKPGNEIALRIDQALLQDVLGTLVMLELEAMGVDRVRIDRAAQYIDHNLLETDDLNGDEHLLRSACPRFGIWYSRPGNGISHPVHMQRFGKPGDTLIGSDSHTAAAGSMGIFAFGAGGVDFALALAGEPAHLRMPAVFGIKLTGQLRRRQHPHRKRRGRVDSRQRDHGDHRRSRQLSYFASQPISTPNQDPHGRRGHQLAR
jgi:aconitate hydratase